ncbi:MAG: DUF4266 domain-containing protein [Bacteroidales bacterium]|nr:DUF4266 domain-containing protein [Bacteroidales bacterium]
MRIWIVFIFICTASIFISCSTVKPWQRTYLNDPGMQMAGSPGKTFEDYVQSIRTGSVVAGSYKSAGGCGCN